MWGWIFVFLTLALLFYVFLLKRELRKLTHEMKEMPIRASYGGRFSLDFREKALMELIDELNQMIDAFEEKNLRAKQMEENVKLSIAGLSHDLRTPLTSVNGYVQLLNETTDDVKRKHYIRIIEQSVERLIAMTDYFYDIARIEANEKEMNPSSILLSNLVEEIFLSYYEQFAEHNIEIDFPKRREDSLIIADEFMLARVIQNIAQNILRYAKNKVFIHYEKEGNITVFTVKNNIKTESKVDAEKVFIRFYTEEASRTNTETSGLGLYLSKKLVEKMNGTMDAELSGNWFILKMKLPAKGN